MNIGLCLVCDNLYWPVTGVCWRCQEAGVIPPKRDRKKFAKLKRRADKSHPAASHNSTAPSHPAPQPTSSPDDKES